MCGTATSGLKITFFDPPVFYILRRPFFIFCLFDRFFSIPFLFVVLSFNSDDFALREAFFNLFSLELFFDRLPESASRRLDFLFFFDCFFVLSFFFFLFIFNGRLLRDDFFDLFECGDCLLRLRVRLDGCLCTPRFRRRFATRRPCNRPSSS